MSQRAMHHYSEDELVLYHYGEGRHQSAIDAHLQSCPACAALSSDIAATLDALPTMEVPERGEHYGLEVWQRIRHRLPAREPSWWAAWRPAAAAAAVAALVVAAFVAGRQWSLPAEPAATTVAAFPFEASERIRLAAISDHLDRTERVLLNLMNAQGEAVDVSAHQAWAGELIDASRLYREASRRAGDEGIAAVLDDLERNLLEIVHGPSHLTPAELAAMRLRLDAAALLFKVRVLSSELRDRERATGATPNKTT
jgi:hypothetical protein